MASLMPRTPWPGAPPRPWPPAGAGPPLPDAASHPSGVPLPRLGSGDPDLVVADRRVQRVADGTGLEAGQARDAAGVVDLAAQRADPLADQRRPPLRQRLGQLGA